MKAIKHPALISLRQKFLQDGFDVRVVGGAVRDFLRGVDPKDVDFATDATPEQQISIFTKHGLRFVPTGLAHGTITVVLDGEPFEITSLRIDAETDGRHAEVRFTNDWSVDAGRRDLTFNAISLTFDGEIVDPFGGQNDLENNRVRFVGVAKDRMEEDYLRILRWLRFHALISPHAPLDMEAAKAAREVGAGLARISKERVWMEISKILKTKAIDIFSVLFELRLAEAIGLPAGNFPALRSIAPHTNSPVTMLAAFLGEKVISLAEGWKWSAAERDQAAFIVNHIDTSDLRAIVALKQAPRDWAVELAVVQYRSDEAEFLRNWESPVFPVRGGDLLSAGVKPGKGMGEMLDKMKHEWVLSNFSTSKDELLTRFEIEFKLRLGANFIYEESRQ